MRAIMDDIFGANLEQNLWIPAAMPYYGAERSGPPLTKALIFSSWSMVPDAVAALLSYEAERRMGVGDSGRRYFEQHRLRPLQFRQDQGRLAGLRALLLIYPSPKLAEIADPLSVFAERDRALSQAAMREAVAERLKPALDALQHAAEPGQEVGVAEWAAPAVIDDLLGARANAWLSAPGGLAALGSEDGFRDHVAELGKAAAKRDYGSVSDDLRDLLVDVALGSPAVCALRALRRIAPELAWDDPRLLTAAAEILAYGLDHNLQSVLDEHAHYLVDAEGLGMRGRLAMRLADYRDDEGAVARLGGVRDAFNSPFRPFVLATTSIGQEGLDFHPYCYRVYHWNLPSNPVDLEQREGRVHRFKGHAVRLNLAERQAAIIHGCGGCAG